MVGDNMNELLKPKFQIVVDKHPKGMWCLGGYFSHNEDETYIFLSLFKVCIAIGKMWYVEVEE